MSRLSNKLIYIIHKLLQQQNAKLRHLKLICLKSDVKIFYLYSLLENRWWIYILSEFHPTCLSNGPATGNKNRPFCASRTGRERHMGYPYTEADLRRTMNPRLELADSSFISTWHAPRSHLAGSWGVNWNCDGDYSVDREFALLHNLISIARIRDSVFRDYYTDEFINRHNSCFNWK